ncbi:GntR family transcriptional regulator [Micromonospora sp. NBC_01813]|uniref:GntR family transcriptional regulator n=1 Tax=Micromonospora sp. NBC_01813 TaxID=2975988 RepID=UPI002DDBCFAC|nr:GntR family transcriptional regulator [Micromonospora sp. NBC_01813]WSA12355.1 GntR family transcriptional regulator [Micromonospora sp. NBC_01813]
MAVNRSDESCEPAVSSRRAPGPLTAERVLRARIDSGEWPPGHKLPGEVTLAQTYDVARGTVRAALDVLRAEGRVVTFTGRGTFVTPGSE